VVFVLYILLVGVFLLGVLSHRFKYADIFAVLAVMLFFCFMPLVFYHSGYEYTYKTSHYRFQLFNRTLAILIHLGEPVRTLFLIQPLAYLTGKMCFEIHKTIKG